MGIYDDVTRLSLEPDRAVRYARPQGEVQAMFFGLGSDGTVGANKSSIKIIGEQTDQFAQGYFVYDSKKAGSVTVSHLRFGPGADPLDVPHRRRRLRRVPPVRSAREAQGARARRPGATFLLNSPWGPDEVWDHLPMEVQSELIAKHIDMWVIDAQRVAHEAQMGNRVNTVMQPCFFALSGVLPTEQAIGHIKAALEKTYAPRGQAIVERNFAAIDASLAALHHVEIPETVTATVRREHRIPDERARVREAGHRAAARRRRRPVARLGAPRRRRLPDGHGQVREAFDRAGDPDLRPGHLHRLRPVCGRVPAHDDPDEGVRPDRAGRQRQTGSGPRRSARRTCRGWR